MLLVCSARQTQTVKRSSRTMNVGSECVPGTQREFSISSGSGGQDEDEHKEGVGGRGMKVAVVWV